MKTATAGASKTSTAGAQGKTDAVSLLKADHRKVEQLFAQFEQSEDDSQKQKLARQICTELIIHTMLEEEIFYPACREKEVESGLMDEAQVEHDSAKVLIADLLQASPAGGYYDAKVKTLSEYIKHHVAEEEQARSGIFAKAQKAGVDMAGLGQKLQARKQELMAQGEAIGSRPPQPRSFQLQPQESSSMARYSNDRDRDERGRFTDDDDNGRGGSRGGSRGGQGGRERDEYGRFASDDDDRGSSRGGGGGRGGRSQGGEGRGWYGDPQGHSQASREGWEDRGSSRSSRGRYDDDDGGRGSARGGQGSGEGRGWYGDPEGHSRASREGWDDRGSSRSSRGRDDDDDDRGSSRGGRGGSQGGRGEGRGWFGDSEGHSQAAREGWEDRGSSRSSRSRDDDDDDRGSSRGGRGGSQGGRGEGHGGWFGDPRGHSEAAREGWRNR